MRCTDCEHSKELVPAQVNYVYCEVKKEEMPTWKEFDKCQVLEKAGGEE